VPEYFEDYCTLPSIYSVVKELTQATAQQKDWMTFIF